MADKIFALQTAEMIGDALEGTARWICDFHTPHQTFRSAYKTAKHELNKVRDADIELMRELYPVDDYNDGDYNITKKSASTNSTIIELVRRDGTDAVPIAQFVVTQCEIWEIA